MTLGTAAQPRHPSAPSSPDTSSSDRIDGFFAALTTALAKIAELVPDSHQSFPNDALRRLHEAGALSAPLPVASGGLGLADPTRAAHLKRLLVTVGRADQVLGRLYEGHVNALLLVLRFGDPRARADMAEDARSGRLFGVWNAEAPVGGVKLDAAIGHLVGAKIYASGAGFIERPLITADLPDGRTQMLVTPLEAGERAAAGGWRMRGMRASATETVSFDDYPLDRATMVGGPDDYQRQPFFSAGAWRFLAVHLGGIEAVHLAHKAHLVRTARHEDAHQLARLGQSAIAVESARSFVDRACAHANDEGRHDADDVVAFVNLARCAVERAGLDVIELAQRSVGLASMHEDHPLERLTRDLSVYLRQPGPDYALASAARRLAEIDRCYLAPYEIPA